MQRLIVQIPDGKMAFFIDLAENPGFLVENGMPENIYAPQAKSKGQASGLRGKMSLMTNEQIDQQFNNMRDEWTKDS